MHLDFKAPVIDSKVMFSKEFEDEFVVMLREIKTETLADMQTNAIKGEANRSISSKLEAKVENDEKRMKERE